MARVATGRISDMMAASSSTASGDIAFENRPGMAIGSNPPGSRSATSSANLSRRSTSERGNEPAQPA
jgi:hypothetical protein